MKTNDMNESDFKELLEKSWRRPLTEDEQSQLAGWFATHPEARSTWDEELLLNRSLENLADAPVSSNFTALVMQAVERDAAAASAPPLPQRARLFFRLSWGIAWVLLLTSASWFALHHQKQSNQAKVRREAEELAVVANLSALPALSDPTVLQDFEAIHRLSLAAGPDEELYAVLSQ